MITPAVKSMVLVAGSLAVAGAGLARPAAPAPAFGEPTTLHLRYAVSLLGLPIGTAGVDGTVGPNTYRLDGTGRLTGLAGIIVDTKGAVTATGALTGARVTPASFAASAGNSNAVLTIRMAEAKGVATDVEVDPAYIQTPDRIPISAGDKRNIIDPMSSFIFPVAGSGDVVGPAACNRTLPLFDGGVRFNILLTYAETRQVSSPAYTGPVAVCAARYQPIAGYRPARPVNKFMIENKQMEVWLAQVGRSRFAYPYRVSIMTMIGMTVVEATEASFSPAAQSAGIR